MSTTAETTLDYESYEFDARFFIHTAKNNITSFAQVIAEAVSNSDEAIERRAARNSEENTGRVEIRYDPISMELTVTEDGDGMTTEVMRSRLKRVGAEAAEGAKRGFFHRGIREAFIAMGESTVESIALKAGQAVYTKAIFHPTKGMATVVSDAEVTGDLRAELNLASMGTRVTVPMKRLAAAKPKQFAYPALRSQIENCVQIRPVLADPNREIVFEYGDAPPRPLRFSYPRKSVV